MAFQRLTRAPVYSGAAPPPPPQVAAPQPTGASVGGFQRLVKPQVVTNPVAAAQAQVRQQTKGGGQKLVATGVAGVKASPTGGIQGVKYAPSGGFFGHLGSDIEGVITGIPSAFVLAAKNVAYVPASAYNLLPGNPLGQHATKQFTKNVEKEDVGVVKATYHDYASRYGPAVKSLVHGHPLAAAENLGHAFYQHPGLVGLDVGAAVGAAGAAARGLGGVAARVAPESAAGRLGARLADTSIRPGSARYREPAVHTDPIAPGTPHESVSTITEPRRPYSKNPLTRELVQKPVGRLAATRVQPLLADAAPSVFGPQARFSRAAARTAREVRASGEEHLNTTVGQLAQGYAKTIKTLKPIQTRMEALKNLPRGLGEAAPHERDVVHLHLRGLLDQPGLAPVQARDRLVNTMRQNIATAKANGERTVQAEKNVARFAAIPEHYLDLSTAPAHIRTAVDEGRALIDETQRRAVESGVVTPETARASAERAVNVTLGGAKWDPAAGAIVKPEGFQAGPQARYLPDIAADRVGRTAVGRSVGRLTQPKVYQSHGTLIGRGGVVTSPYLPVHAARTVVAHEQLTENVGRLIESTAYRHGGQIASGPKAVQLLRSDPDRVVLVSKRSVQHALSQMGELQPGEALNEQRAGELFRQSAPTEAEMRAHPDDFIAIPKAAMDEWRTAAKAPTTLARHYDSALSLWKSGLLAFTPRWYTNNVITNAALYGLASGGDLRALRAAATDAFKRPGVVPERVASTAAAEYGRLAPSLGRAESLPRFKDAAAKGFAFNNRLEGLWRRAAYIHAAKGLLRDEGGKFRGLSQEEVADRIAAMPEDFKREAIRITEQFMGDFHRFSRVERDVIKRVIPFYSWLRFVGSLTLGLPFHSPLRAQALALMSEANKVENPGDWMRALYNRGRINLPFGLSIRTSAVNPASTVSDLVGAVLGGESKLTAAARSIASGGLGPLPQIALGEISGRDPFTGRPYSAPPGFGGAVASFGQDPMVVNPATGLTESYQATPGFLNQLVSSVPFVSQAEQLLAGGRRTYDTTSLSDLVQHALGAGPPAWQLFTPPAAAGSAQTPIPYVSPIAGLLGVPIQRVDPQAEQRQYLQQQARLAAARLATQRAQAKARARVGS